MSRRWSVMVSAFALVALIVGLGVTAMNSSHRAAREASRAAELAGENAGLRAELADTRQQLEILAARVDQLTRVISDAGLDVPPPVTVVVQDRRPSTPTTSSTTSTTSTPAPSSTSTTTTCSARVAGVCIP